MPKVENWGTYFEELAGKAGLDLKDEQVAKTLEAIKNSKEVQDGLVPRPNYSSDLDSVKAKTEKDLRDSVTAETKEFYENWAKTDVQPTLDKAVASVDELARFKALYGELDSTTPNPTYTKEQAEKDLNDKLAAMQAASIDMNKKSMRVAARHLHDFNEVLDPDELEKFAQTNKFNDINAAYEAYTKPRREEAVTKEWEAKLATAKEEGIKEGASRATANTIQEKEYVSPFMKPKEDLDPRAEFMAGFEEAANQ